MREAMLDPIAHLGLVEETEIELDKAALEIAALDHPEADLSPYLELLEQMEDRLRARAAPVQGLEEQAQTLAVVLAGEYNLKGDRSTYEDPANADLMRVLDRRRGLPVALSILYVALARRLGWAAHALNTPGHVLVGVGRRQMLLIDPFSRGAFVSRGQLTALLLTAKGRVDALKPEHLTPMGSRAVLVRLMMNQAARAEQTGQFTRALTVFERITTVAPAYTLGWWERARLERALGEVAAARRSLSSMLETTRDAEMRSQVMVALDALAG
jgi:regulator of sirC expression with transglutaminase-like and TPR domain